jgi:hypothetical protein
MTESSQHTDARAMDQAVCLPKKRAYRVKESDLNQPGTKGIERLVDVL